MTKEEAVLKYLGRKVKVQSHTTKEIKKTSIVGYDKSEDIGAFLIGLSDDGWYSIDNNDFILYEYRNMKYEYFCVAEIKKVY